MKAIFVLKTSCMLETPFCQSIPVLAHFDLTLTCSVRSIIMRPSWCIISIALYILPQLIKTMNYMLSRNSFVRLLLSVLDVTKYGPLFSNTLAIKANNFARFPTVNQRSVVDELKTYYTMHVVVSLKKINTIIVVMWISKRAWKTHFLDVIIMQSNNSFVSVPGLIKFRHSCQIIGNPFGNLRHRLRYISLQVRCEGSGQGSENKYSRLTHHI